MTHGFLQQNGGSGSNGFNTIACCLLNEFVFPDWAVLTNHG